MKTELVIHPGSLLRAVTREYRKLDDRFGGKNASLFHKAVDALQADAKLLLEAGSGNRLPEGKVFEAEYDGEKAVVFEGNSYKFVLLHFGKTEELMVVSVFEKTAL